jgi:UDP-3-O-[3-hydroxymyristoyl] glucosamine N-acyltransferase
VEVRLSELAVLLGGDILSGDGEIVLTGINSLSEAQEGDLSFFGNEKYLTQLRATHASAVLVPLGFSEVIGQTALIAVSNPSLAFGRVIGEFGAPPKPFVPGVDATAVIDSSALLDRSRVRIGPRVVIEEGVRIGPGTDIGAGSFLGEGVTVGVDCRFHPGVTILRRCILGSRVILHSGVVIGADGFGFQFDSGRHEKLEQVGVVQIDDDVEIGANSCVDRARFGRTWIGEGTKIDNLVQIAHNVVIGKHCVIAGQTGIAGSTRLGDGVILAAQVGVAGHLELSSGVIVTAQSGVSKSLSVPGAYTGYYAQPMREMMKILAASRQVPALLERVRRLERQLEQNDGRNA